MQRWSVAPPAKTADRRRPDLKVRPYGFGESTPAENKPVPTNHTSSSSSAGRAWRDAGL